MPSDRSDCKQIIEQVNYTNQCLKVIGEQLDKIETKINEGETSCTPSSSKIIEKPLILLPEKRSQIRLNSDKNIQKIEDMLQKLIVKSEPVKTQVAVLTQTDEDSSQPSSTDDEISNLQAQFTSQPGNPGNIKRLVYPTTNPTSLTKNWYSRPTPPDLQFEENNLANQFSVSSSKLYEWNIDGLSEHQILEKLNHMSMAANSYLSNTDLDQAQIVDLLTSGFTGMLKAWWDKYLTSINRQEIKHAIQTDNSGVPIFDHEMGTVDRVILDGVNTLIYTIIKHFVGQPSNITSRIHDQLSNLHCPTLSDFRWYKDVFISRVMMRDDCTKPFWKEKFINGLPGLFAHKIRDVLSQPTGTIEYDRLTYGDIVSTIQKEGLRMCIDMKIAKQSQKDKDKAKYELGNFCEQYGLPPVAPSRRKKKIEKKKQDKKVKTESSKDKFYDKTKSSDKKTNFSDKKKTDSPDKKKKDSTNVTCFNCGKKGHYKSQCKVKEKISQLIISDDDKQKILDIFKMSNLSDTESSDSSEYHSISDDSSNDQIKIGCTDNCCRKINVLTKELSEEELLIDLISKVDDIVLKQQYIKKLKQVFTQQSQKPVYNKPIINLHTTLERFEKTTKVVTLQDLQLDIEILKNEVNLLKSQFPKWKQRNKKYVRLSDHSSDGSVDKNKPELPSLDTQDDLRLNLVNQIFVQKWHAQVKLLIGDFVLNITALIDTGADLNCIQEELIPSQYYQKTTEKLSSANGSKMIISHKLPTVNICQNEVCFKTSFVLVKNLTDKVILGMPFIYLLYPFTVNFDKITSTFSGQQINFELLSAPSQNDLLQLQNYSINHSALSTDDVQQPEIWFNQFASPS
ncbi:hypothetical protein RHMOL_Rhmol03G0127200 [Rhododendron molle]|uniref:Uncharacterized protein n=1 Tax=Rhododendron molle TaxID=49168 RepID=A0ACC0PEQ7_RHOML|nr:hypothetical protein RHMOL_Rhmol03G0127200 [Rhododendron molle]